MNGKDLKKPEQIFRIEGMHCGSCVARLEQGLQQCFPELTEVRVNLATGQAVLGRATSTPPVSTEAVQEAVSQWGYQAFLYPSAGSSLPDGTVTDSNPKSKATNPQIQTTRFRLTLAVILTAPLMILHMAGFHFKGAGWVQFLLSTIVLFYCGQSIFKSAWQRLKHLDNNMDTLVALGAGVAWLASILILLNKPRPHADLYFETAAMIITLILLGRYLEANARQKAGAAIEALMRLQPTTALKLIDGAPQETPVETLQVDDLILVRPGSRIPLDGVILDGETSIDESMMTGESMPVAKKTGDSVIGGTQNQAGGVTVRVTQTGVNTTLARLIDLVEKAQTGKPAVQRLADRVAGIFVPIVLTFSVVTLAGWLIAGYSWQEGLNAAVSVLVIACPCALGLATPTAIQVGLGRAASEGILIRDVAGLELAQKLDVLIMDKTGTLTLGQPEVVAFYALNHFSETDCLRWAALLESHSEHLLANAIVQYAVGQIPADWQHCTLENFISHTGAGVLGRVDGVSIAIGKPAFLLDHGILVASLVHRISKASIKGQTPVVMAVGQKLAALFLLADPLKPEVPAAIRRLRNMGIKPLMLSGDRQETAVMIGLQAGLNEKEIHGNLTPQDKLAFLKDLQQDEEKGVPRIIGMVGDGINDAPALAQADVSIAMGTGTDIAMQTAQFTLVQGNMTKAAEAVRLSRMIMHIVRQNLFWAFFYNLVALPAAAFGLLNPMVAAAAMSLSSITVVLNALRLKSIRL